MKEYHIFYAPDIAATGCLPAEESAHAVRVLRLREGDALVCTDGSGHFFDCTIEKASQKQTQVSILHVQDAPPLWHGRIELAIAPTKSMDRVEWFVEKATEIGVDSIAFLECCNSERRIIKTDRIERILVSAMKQSHKACLPQLHPFIPFDEYLRQPFEGQRFICHCYDTLPNMTPEQEPRFLGELIHPTGTTRVLIGPEGDFSVKEVKDSMQAGYVPVTLGGSRLRTETAALAAVHLMYIAKKTS